ncbi:hypothetical protein WEB32_01215 [Streptomyces netropsis]|uniref:Uncharacterized protein n=1 Tax=Streptomyces netropsis TaxID=55404 RepID=A0A7W7PER7_STRNE|nr:hypothetical protein [Streptomyces netropsis]MBB4888141.1 hypothetical protein [Streptomyces netropsis]
MAEHDADLDVAALWAAVEEAVLRAAVEEAVLRAAVSGAVVVIWRQGLPPWRSGEAGGLRVSSHTSRRFPFGIHESHPRCRFLRVCSSNTAAAHRTGEHHAYSRVQAA